MIPIIVFLSGCIIMSFEILGSRILAPHFGNDVFIWGGLYALSSLGSIFGTLLTSFYLITLIGVRTIIVAEGVLLLLMAGAAWSLHRQPKGAPSS